MSRGLEIGAPRAHIGAEDIMKGTAMRIQAAALAPALALWAALSLAAPPAARAEAENPFGFDMEKFTELQQRLEEEARKLEEAAREAAKGLSRDFTEKLEGPLAEMLGALNETLPELLDEIGDMPAYEAPVILPNGDILIRRKQKSPYGGPPKEGEVDL